MPVEVVAADRAKRKIGAQLRWRKVGGQQRAVQAVQRAKVKMREGMLMNAP